MMGGERLDISVKKCLIHRHSINPFDSCFGSFFVRFPGRALRAE